MSTKDKVFISYSHPFEKETNLVKKIEAHCKEHASFEIVREKNNVKKRDSFNRYMKKIGRGWMILIILSEEYFQSDNCMFELLEIDKNNGIDERRVIPIVLDEYCCNKADMINAYVEDWQNKDPVLFDKSKITKGLISKICLYHTISYKQNETDLGELITEIDGFLIEKKQEEKDKRERNLTEFRGRLLEDLRNYLESCNELKQQIRPNIESMIPSSISLSEAQLKKSLQSLFEATDEALTHYNIKHDHNVKENICYIAEEVFKIFFLLSFDGDYFVNKKINFNDEKCLRYETSLRSRTLVEGYLANEYNIPIKLVRDTQGDVYGVGDLNQFIGSPNGWGVDQKEENYKAIHYKLDVGCKFEMQQYCYDGMNEAVKVKREYSRENYYYSVDKKDTAHSFNTSETIVNELQEEIPALAIIGYGGSEDDETLIIKEITLDTITRQFYKLLSKHQTHANKKPNKPQ